MGPAKRRKKSAVALAQNAGKVQVEKEPDGVAGIGPIQEDVL